MAGAAAAVEWSSNTSCRTEGLAESKLPEYAQQMPLIESLYSDATREAKQAALILRLCGMTPCCLQ